MEVHRRRRTSSSSCSGRSNSSHCGCTQPALANQLRISYRLDELMDRSSSGGSQEWFSALKPTTSEIVSRYAGCNA